jgi:O-antigen/teichoic acid export membrane protein
VTVDSHPRPLVSGATTLEEDATARPPGGRLARHTAWNLAAVAMPFAVGVATIPVLTRELGAARFGIIGIAWAVLEYLAVFDAGLGRATVHFVARQLHGAGGVPGRVVALSLVGQTALGALAGGLLAVLAPWLATSLLNVPAALQDETRRALLVLGACVPLTLLGLALRGLLEAAERFDLAAAIRIPSSTAMFVVPAIAAAAGASVPQILLALLFVRLAACVATWLLVQRYVPQIRWSVKGSLGQLRSLAAFGGWVAVSNLLSPVFLLLDRVVLGALVGVAAVGFYTAPYEAVARLLVLPAALVGALFPRISAAAAASGAAATGSLPALYLSTTRLLATVMLGVATAGLVLAPDLLALWLGAEFATHATVAMRLLLVGVLANAVSHVPFAFVQALGRPDLTARFHLAELVVHVPLTLVLVQRWSIAGAAAAWTVRALLDALLVSVAAHRLLGVRGRAVFQDRWPRLIVALAGLAAALVGLQAATGADGVGAAVRLGGVALVGAVFAVIAWMALLLPADRAALRAALVRRG